MSEKPVNPLNENSENKKELSPAEKIHQKVNQLKSGNKSEEISEDEKETTKEEQIVENNNEDLNSGKTEIISNNNKENSSDKDKNENSEVTEQTEIKETDFSGLTIKELVEKLNQLLKEDYNPKIDKTVYQIKDAFNLKNEEEKEAKKKVFIEDGGKEEDFEYLKTDIENNFKELFQKFKDKKETFEIRLNEEKKKNLELKYSIIEEIKKLINKPESFTKTFNKFKNLQKRWNEIGLVPKNNVKELMDEYNINIQKFYEYIEVNKELRELDFKKNYEIKIGLCEKAEELILETNYNKAKKELQLLHKKWKETGTVSNEVREELWARFQAATIKINENFSQYLDEIKEQQQKNLEAKQFLVEQVEELAQKEYITHIDWKNASDKVIEIQRLWKKIGYVPKEFNTSIYKQFKTACDTFFERIRKYYDETEKDREDNYQKKLDLCIRAESLQDSTEWVKTSEILKQIQEEWKKIGPIPKKQSDEIWKRFRKACNNFFDRKKEFYKNRKKTEKENLAKKQEIIERIEKFELSDNRNEDLQKLKELQNEFLSIGYVPFDQKDTIYENYHNAVNSAYEKLDISKDKLEELKFAETVESLKNSPDAEYLISKEISKIQNQIDKLNDDIKVWENNIGFFKSSSNSDSLLGNIQQKIDRAKSKVDSLKKKIIELENSLD